MVSRPTLVYEQEFGNRMDKASQWEEEFLHLKQSSA